MKDTAQKGLTDYIVWFKRILNMKYKFYIEQLIRNIPMKKFIKLVSGLILLSAIAGCGGGGGPCGEPNQIFSISFRNSEYFGRVGTALTVSPTINPESCINDMSLQLAGGRLPPGMSISNGKITGTPTTAGNYQFSIGIAGVAGYDTGSRFASATTTIVISR
jgi:hypothetical protein